MTTRRDLLVGSAVAALAGCGPAAVTGPAANVTVTAAKPTSGVAKRPLGRTGVSVSMLALGGYHLGAVKDEATAVRIVHEAIDHGVTFMDNAWEYHEGKSEEWMGKAIADKRDQVFLMTKVCTHGRDATKAMAMLEDSLRRLRTDHIDLWQVHEVVYDNDPELHHRQDGVISALDRAKSQGKVRFVGFTGHKDPSIHLKMLSFGYAFDTVQMPLNVMDATFRSFEGQVLPVLSQRNIGAIGMKCFGGTADMIKKAIITPEEALRYTLSLPIASLVSGIDSLEVLRQNLKVAQSFTPMSAEEMDALRKRMAVHAGDGRYELYKTSKRFDGKPGREQHGFADDSKLPL
jgi:aryl-alcohol dehydrogenase-like predicted oxidoreductase